MDQLVTALGPVFAVGLALQALIEWLDGPFFQKVLFDNLLRAALENKLKGASSDEEKEQKKKEFKSGVVRTVAIIIGVGLAIVFDLEVLGAFEQITQDFGIFDNVVAGFVISLGTDGINQIIKFVQRAKENQEQQALGEGG